MTLWGHSAGRSATAFLQVFLRTKGHHAEPFLSVQRFQGKKKTKVSKPMKVASLSRKKSEEPERKTATDIVRLAVQGPAGLQPGSKTVLHLQWVHNPSTYTTSAVSSMCGRAGVENLKQRGRVCCRGAPQALRFPFLLHSFRSRWVGLKGSLMTPAPAYHKWL